MPVGTASMIADVFEKWVEEADIDGFNMACKTTLQFCFLNITLKSVSLT